MRIERAERNLAGWSDPERRMRAVLEKNDLPLFCQPIAELSTPDAYPIAEVLVGLREIGVGYAQSFGVAQPAPMERVFHNA